MTMLVEQGAGQAVNAAMQLIVGRTFHGDRRTFLFNDHLRPQALSQFALGSLDGDHIALSNVHGNTGGNGNGHSTNSRHCSNTSLPYECKDFAADVSRASSLVGHDALGSGYDRNTKATQHAGQLVGAHIDAQAGLGHAAQAGDDLLLAGVVLQGDADGALSTVVNDLEGLDVASSSRI